ncbi:hypothetical protein PFLUV_G00089620 [Perca fluviatilis]|uniref:C-type lectin domain-containing protein n=1 Tax=Perca fluviatilis TaxID=8168 RepID=A0A6A5FEY7_PERFL|nr:hypothetical protein PFLUV_G00089620 [Perca fluviatilis]
MDTGTMSTAQQRDHVNLGVLSSVLALEMTWNESKTSCEEHGGILAIIPNKAMNSEVKIRLSEFSEAWIGLSRHQMNVWYWSESGVNYMFTNWQNGQPERSRELFSCCVVRWKLD